MPNSSKTSKIEEYFINYKKVSKEEFNNFLKSLKEIPKTWYCAELKDGGDTGYDSIDSNGEVYSYKCQSRPSKTKFEIILKSNLELSDNVVSPKTQSKISR